MPLANTSSIAATITPVATAVPPYAVTQSDAIAIAERTFRLDHAKARALGTLFDNSGVGTRYSVRPLADIERRLTLTESNAAYCEHALGLGRKVARDALALAGVKAEQIDLVITASCTGLMIPSLDARLAGELGFRPDVKRLPITELGCAAGACALARAHDYLRGHPGQNVLVITVELPTLTFQGDDLSAQNLVSSALFGDGAAATVVRGVAAPGVEILDTCSYQLPGTTGAMGFQLETAGLHIVLSKEMPVLVSRSLDWLAENFFGRHGLCAADLAFAVVHPGGRKILDIAQTKLALPDALLAPSRATLRAYGNVSAASVLFVLEAWQKLAPAPSSGSLGAMVAFGPGISTEALLLRWR
ncbi:MAG TPA: 3-oxoacyl-[acyl-carrier-protein] synthase III C-terminal domain-containing protein [Polyangiaceae bacterium]|jgi:alkylresorcinol/alkylpyrone synthase